MKYYREYVNTTFKFVQHKQVVNKSLIRYRTPLLQWTIFSTIYIVTNWYDSILVLTN